MAPAAGLGDIPCRPPHPARVRVPGAQVLVVAASSLPTHPPVPSCIVFFVSIATGKSDTEPGGTEAGQEGLCFWAALGCLQALSVLLPSPRWYGGWASCPASWVLCQSFPVHRLQQEEGRRNRSAPRPSSPVLSPNATSLSPGVGLPTQGEEETSREPEAAWPQCLRRSWGQAGLGVLPCSLLCVPQQVSRTSLNISCS